MVTLTVFTPAFNRAHTLTRTYESLCRQSSHDFKWLIIDDGSSDSTRDLVISWIENVEIHEKIICGYSKLSKWLKIIYIYQENQGMHGAHNTAYDNIDTELNICIDSDDYMPDDAVDKIVRFWNRQPKATKKMYAGIIGLDVNDKTGKVIGEEFPIGLKSTTLSRYYGMGHRGDKKLIYRTEVIKSVPKYPLFDGEKYVGLNYKYVLVDQKYELLVLNEPLVIVDYQTDGSSSSMFRQYWNNPRGWSFYRKFEMVHSTSLKRKFIVCIHYVSSSIICKNKNFIAESPCKILTLLAIPFGWILYKTIRSNVNLNISCKIRSINE